MHQRRVGVLGLRLDVTSARSWGDFLAAPTADLATPDVLVNGTASFPSQTPEGVASAREPTCSPTSTPPRAPTTTGRVRDS